MARIIDGKEIAQSIISDLNRTRGTGVKRLCFIYFGDNLASKKYMAVKSRMARELGIETETIESDALTTKAAEKELSLMADRGFDGIVVQLPLRKGLDTERLLNAVPEAMDIDMLSGASRRAYERGRTKRVPPVARAVDEIIKRSELDLSGKKVIVLGKGRLVGEPVSMLLEQLKVPYKSLDASTPTPELMYDIKSADVIISGIGSPAFITPRMVKDGVVLLDAGTSGEAGKLHGDVDPKCGEKASLMTPVPGGIGPITVAALFANLYS